MRTQVEDAFLDDLLVAIDDLYQYYQIKNVKDLRWRSLEHDFDSQFEKSTENKENFKLALVYSDSSFSPNISDKLRPYTELIFFPYTDSLYSLIDSYKPFKDSLIKLCAIKKPANDSLFGIATAIIGIWCSINRHTGISIKDFANQLRLKTINTILNSNKGITNECKRILDSIPNFSYEIKGNNINWDCEYSTGNSTVWTPELEDTIIKNKPSSIKDIFKLL